MADIDNIKLNITVLEEQNCTCIEWVPCDRCVKLVELKKSIGVYPFKTKPIDRPKAVDWVIKDWIIKD